MITFRQYLAEGGWSKKETQSTKLTPAVAKKAVAVLPQFERDFNAFLKKKGLPPIAIGRPVGSSSYIERDLKDNPDKEYGDIDVLMTIPRLEGTSEAKNNSTYSDAVKEFAGEKERSYMLHDKESFGNAIIVKVDDGYAQVDLVRTFGEHAAWAADRMTPEHGLKGALLGNLYTSFGELFHVSIGPAGVAAKEKDGELVSSRTLKPDKVHGISLDISKFAQHIVEFIHKRINDGSKLKLVGLTGGMNRENIKATDLAKIIKSVGKTFAANEMFGKGPLKGIADYDEYIAKIKKIYIDKNTKAAGDAKFNKADTPEAKARAEQTKDLLLNKSKEIASLLD